MNQDELLEHLWVQVIDRGDEVGELVAGKAKRKLSPRDLKLVARHARYAAVFAWCAAFDEAGDAPATWLQARQRGRWTKLAARGAGQGPTGPSTRRRSEDAPFADADDALDRLVKAGASAVQLGKLIERAWRVALDGARAILEDGSFGPDELGGLHEALLSADPSGQEGRPGSWPRRKRAAATPKPAARGRLVTLGKAHALAFSPDGARVVAASGGAITTIKTGKVVATCALLANTGDIAWSPDGRWIAATNTSGKIAVCDARTGKRLHVLAMTGEGPGAVFSVDGARVYAGDWGGNVFAWEVATGREVRRSQLTGAMIKDLAVRREGLVLLVSHRPRPVVVVALSPELDELGPPAEVPDRSNHLAVSAAGPALLLGYEWIARIDLGSGALTDRQEVTGVRGIACSPDGRWFAVSHRDGFRVGATSDLGRGTELPARAGAGVSFSPDSTQVALATSKAGEVWELARLPR